MAGRGPAPKDPSRRVRTNKDPIPTRLVELEPTEPPELPDVMPDGEPWPEQTRKWWAIWGRTPLTAEFGDPDWADLLDTATIHGRYWSTGAIAAATELRLRVAKLGATPEDRARLRIQFAHADEADSKRPVSPARERRTVLHALPETG